MPDDGTGPAKIADPELCDFLRSGSHDSRQVLIEVDAPEPTVRFGRALGDALRPQAVDYSKASQDKERQAVDATRSLLASLQVPAKFSASARTFAASVTPEQLRRILALPTVRHVVPNRQFTVTR